MAMYKLLVFLSMLILVSSNEVEQTSQKDNPTTVSAPYYYNTAMTAAAVVAAGAGLVALTAFFFPVMAYRVCYALGGCQNTMDSYVDELIGKQLGMARNIRTRNKRAVEYIEPILVTLAKAYEAYGGNENQEEGSDGKKNFKRPNYYIR